MKRQSIGAKGIVHQRVTVTRQGERLYFDLFLPEGAVAFTSVCAVADAAKAGPAAMAARTWQDGTAGHLALRWDRPGNVFLMQRVDLLETFERDLLPCGLQHPGGGFWQSTEMQVCGTRLHATPVRIPWDCRHIRGAYVDAIGKARGTSGTYNVDIHLTYTQRQ
jgi:hypothetical protein